MRGRGCRSIRICGSRGSPVPAPRRRSADGRTRQARREVLCDLFWAQLPWPALARAIGPIHLLDLGCGSGGYAAKFRAWASGAVEHYTGVDIEPRASWASAAADGFADFKAGDVERAGELLPPDANVIVSQSTLEHVRSDRSAFEGLHEVARARGRPLLQMHAVPSPARLRLYLWHGYGRIPRTVSAVTAPFARTPNGG